MKRSGPIARHSRIRRGTTRLARSPMRHRNPARKAREWTRGHGSPERVEWIKSLPSVASGKRPCENAHVRGGGGSRKADACWIVPLTRHEHRVELHQWGKQTFEAHYGIDLDALAAQTEAAWQALVQAGALTRRTSS